MSDQDKLTIKRAVDLVPRTNATPWELVIGDREYRVLINGWRYVVLEQPRTPDYRDIFLSDMTRDLEVLAAADLFFLSLAPGEGKAWFEKRCPREGVLRG